MESFDLLRKLFEHKQWANLAALESLRTSPDSEPARKIFSHILAADLVWLGRITGNEFDTSELWKILSLDEIERRNAEVSERWKNFFSELENNSARLEEKIFYANTKGERFENSLCEILTHVALHAQYHRAQIASLIKSGGSAPAVTDFIQFVREDQLSNV